MFRNGAKSIAGLSGRTSRIAKALPAFKWNCAGISRTSFRCFSASSGVNSASCGDDATASGSDAVIESGFNMDTPSSPEGTEGITEGITEGFTEGFTEGLTEGVTDGIVQIAQLSVPDLGYTPSHLAIQAIENIHLMCGIPYWEAIAVTTLALRFILLPSAIVVVRDVSKMRALKPEMKRIKESFISVSSADDPTVRFKYGAEITKLMKHHNIHPIVPVAISAFQIPVFLSFFFGLREMGSYYPGYMSGGDYWFTDLSSADPYYILPFLNAASFLLMVEIGANPDSNPLKWPIRGLAVFMGPLTAAMPSGLFMYWIVNNSLSIAQITVLKNNALRKILGIAMPPPLDDLIDKEPPFEGYVKRESVQLGEVEKADLSVNKIDNLEKIDGMTVIEELPSGKIVDMQIIIDKTLPIIKADNSDEVGKKS